MKAIELYKFINKNGVEFHWNYNGDERDNNQEVENQQEPSGGEDGHDQYHFWLKLRIRI